MTGFRKAFTLAEVPEARQYGSKRAAFTLAEVLITLGIIGVVAAMTIPTLMQHYNDKITVVRMKKMYTTLTNAYKMYSALDENPSFETTSRSADDAVKVANVFIPYLKISKDCGLGVKPDCMYQGFYKFLNGNNNEEYGKTSNSYKILLQDGSSLWFAGGYGNAYQSTIYFDVNGAKEPNMWGKDLFVFLMTNNAIIPIGHPNVSNVYPFSNCTSVSAYERGVGCAAWVIMKGNLDYLKCPDVLTWDMEKCPN